MFTLLIQKPGKDNFDASLETENPEPPEGKGAAKNLVFPDTHFTYVKKSIV